MEIRELYYQELYGAALLLSRGMHANPLHIAAFGSDADRRLRMTTGFFRVVLRGLYHRGSILGAFDGGALLGVCGMARPGRCKPALGEKLWILPGLLTGGSPGAPVRVLRWAGAWARHDPVVPHWHLGPVAVHPELQGQGIGSALLNVFCERMDEAGALAYLETDKRENVGFYEKHGFVVDAEELVLGVPNWYMSRP